MLRNLFPELLNFLFPPLCHLCRSFIADANDVHLCPECRSGFTPIAVPYCTVCGAPFTGVGENHPCGSCLSDPPAYDSLRAVFAFQGGIKDLLHSYKYTPKPHLRKVLALLIAEQLSEYHCTLKPDLILPVPLHAKRLRQRGFNQALLLGELLSQKWQINLERSLLQRIRWTEPQVTLSGVERRTNVKGAFAVQNESGVTGKKVLLIDDVVTTGSTLIECSKVLKSAGAKEVHCLTVARAI